MRSLVLIAVAVSMLAATKPITKPAKPAAKPAASKVPKTLTKADLVAAKELVKPFQPWTDSLKKVTDKVGPPAKTDGDRNFWWVKDGDTCVEFEMDKMKDQVGTNGIAEYGKAMKDGFAKCDAVK